MRAAIESAKLLRVAGSGRGRPGGGIIPTFSILIAFSASAAVWSGWARSTFVQVNPPDLSLSLWQPAQYLVTRACWFTSACWAASWESVELDWASRAPASPASSRRNRNIFILQHYTFLLSRFPAG